MRIKNHYIKTRDIKEGSYRKEGSSFILKLFNYEGEEFCFYFNEEEDVIAILDEIEEVNENQTLYADTITKFQ